MKKADQDYFLKEGLDNSGEFNVFQSLIIKHKKLVLLMFATFCIATTGFAQRTADIGIWGGTSMYFGDLVETAPLQSYVPAFGAYYRYNFDARLGLRAMLLAGKVSESGVIEGEPWSFDKGVQDFSIQAEINYLKYILGNKNTPFTSYITAGLGVTYVPYTIDPAEYARFNPAHNKGGEDGTDVLEGAEIAASIPFGFGFKYSLSRRLGIGIEYQMRKLLTDKLDDLDDPLAYITPGGSQVLYTGKYHNNDWIGYLGVHVTYKIYIGKSVCPVYENIAR